MRKRIISILLAILTIASLFHLSAVSIAARSIELFQATSSGSCGANAKWNLNTNTGVLSITGSGEMANYNSGSAPWYSYCSSIKTVVISNGITSIGDCSFYYCTSMTNVSIPNSVVKIGKSAFYSCHDLTDLIIPKNVTDIGYSAFSYCTSLTDIKLPDSLKTIGSCAFSTCTSVESITIPNSVTTIDGYAFGGCWSLKSISVPDSIDQINNGLFSDCKALTKVSLPNTITKIGNNAFSGCTSLTGITLPDKITNIGDDAFYGSNSLKKINIPLSVSTIGFYAFGNCSSLSTVNYPGSPEDWKKISIDTGNDCLKHACDKAVDPFSGMCGKKLNWVYDYRTAKLTISGTGDMYDYGYSSSNGAPWCFDEEILIDTVIIENGVTSIGTNAFMNTAISSITVPATIKKIGGSAFYNCFVVNRVNITDLEAWCKIAFNGFYSAPLNNDDSGGGDIYLNGSRITSLVIPDGITEIGNCTFCGCESIKSVTIPASVKSIDFYAFENCNSLTDVYFSGSEEQWNSIFIDETNTHLVNANIHYQISTSLKYGKDRFSFSNDITGYVGETVRSLLFYSSTTGNIASLDIKSSNPDVVGIGTIEIGVGEYITLSEYEHIATVPLILKQIGESTITVSSPEGLSVSVKVKVKAPTIIDETEDSDGDGLLDIWEIKGLDSDGNGTIDLNLPAMGADPNVPDIFVEVDWMVRPQKNCLWWETQSYKSFAPFPDSMKLVYNVFKSHGINLHVDVGPDSIDYVTEKKWGNLSGGNEIPYEEKFDINKSWTNTVNSNFSESRYNVFKYCLFINIFKGKTSGRANDIPGQFFIVSNQDWVYNGGITSVGGTFMHELGHTLGMHHGGRDDEHYKPNYISIMNYAFQTTGLVSSGAINYSDYKLPDLDELHVNENNGIDPGGLTKEILLGTTLFYRTKKQINIGRISKIAIDFNGNGKYENDISIDLNPGGNVDDPAISVLRGYEDWSNIVFNGGNIGIHNDLTNSLQNNKLNGITFPINEKGLIEKTLEESLMTSTLAANDTGFIELVPQTLVPTEKRQQLFFDVYNMTSNDCSFDVRISCKELINDYIDSISVDPSVDFLSCKRISLPITKSFEDGVYTIDCFINNAHYSYSITAYSPTEEEIKELKNLVVSDIDIENKDIIDLFFENHNPFTDIPQDAWFTSAALWCNLHGYITGTSSTTFSPNVALTRAMFVQILARVAGVDLDSMNYKGKFTDVKAGDWYAKAVQWAVDNGITGGTSATTFSPNTPVTREQLATFFYAYTKSKGYDVSASAGLGKYTDAGQISNWATNAIKWAVAEGLISGTSETTISPKMSATRAQAAVIFKNFVEIYVAKQK